MKVRIKVAKLHSNATLPRYSHDGPFGDLAADLAAAACNDFQPAADNAGACA